MKIDVTRVPLLKQAWDNFRKNLFKPLLLFFYMGFSVPLLKVAFEFPHVFYQGLTIYLLVAIGWHGGEELADLSGSVLRAAAEIHRCRLHDKLFHRHRGLYCAAGVHSENAKGRRGDGVGLLRFRLGRHVRYLPGSADSNRHQIRGVHAGHAGCHGNPGLSRGAVPRVAVAARRNGRARKYAG